LRPPRTGHNPDTSQRIHISVSRVAKFKIGKQVKSTINAALRRRVVVASAV
jgi:nucleoid DNA-binding protein